MVAPSTSCLGATRNCVHTYTHTRSASSSRQQTRVAFAVADYDDDDAGNDDDQGFSGWQRWVGGWPGWFCEWWMVAYGIFEWCNVCVCVCTRRCDRRRAMANWRLLGNVFAYHTDILRYMRRMRTGFCVCVTSCSPSCVRVCVCVQHARSILILYATITRVCCIMIPIRMNCGGGDVNVVSDVAA